MKELGKIIFYLIATVVLGTLLAPCLYWAGHALAARGVLTWLENVGFRRYFHRGILVAAIVLLWPVTRWLRVPGVRGLGLAPNPWRGRDAFAGLSLAFLPMMALGAAFLACHVAAWKPVFPWADLGTIAVSAVTVSFLEEWLFRGAILGLLVRALPKGGALFATSALFSILHFMKSRGPSPEIGPIGWLSGFSLIPDAFAQFSQPWLVLGGFTTLFFVGWILGWSRLETRSLAMPIGLHAGWVLGTMGFSKVTQRLVPDMLPWFGENLTIGVGSVAVVLFTSGLVWAWLRRIHSDGGNARRSM